MIEKLEKRIRREHELISRPEGNSQVVSDQDLFRQLGDKVKVNKK